MARAGRDILLQLKGDSTDATRSINAVKSDLKRMSKEEVAVRIDIQTARVERQIEQVKRRLESLSKKPASAKVNLDTKRAQEQLILLEFRLDKLNLKKVNIDVDVKRGGFERAASLTGGLERRVTGLGGAFTNILRAVPLLGTTLGFALKGLLGIATQVGSMVATAVTSIVGSIGKLGGIAGPIGSVVGGLASVALQGAAVAALAGGLVIALNAVLGAVVALGSAVVAMVASLAAAAGGLAALGIAFAGILAPAVLVLIGLFQRFGKIMEARKAREQALTQAVQDQKSAEDQRRGALLSLEQAEARLANTVVEGRRAMAQAAEEQGDAERSLERSRLGVQRSRLNLKDARAELREFLRAAGAVGPSLNSLTKKFTDVDFDPSVAGRDLGSATGKGVSGDKSRELQDKILAVKEAQLGVKDAVDGVGDSERALAEARRQQVRFTEQGLRAYKPYRQALVQVERAQNGLRRATGRTSAAQRDYQRKLQELTPTERGTMERIDSLAKGFTRLAKAFTDPIFKALNDTFDSLAGKGGFLEEALKRIGTAMGGVVRSIGSFLREPATRDAFKQMAAGAADLTRQLGARAFTSFLRIMREIATAALPALRSGARRVANALEDVASKPARIRSVVKILVDHFKTWAGLAWQVLRAVVGVFRGAAGPGQQLAENLKKIVKRFADWANSEEGQRKIRAFFRRMITRAKEIVRQIIRIAVWLKDNLPSAAAKAKRGFEDMKPIIEVLVALLERGWDAAKGLAEAIDDPLGRKDANRGSRNESKPGFDRMLKIVNNPDRSAKARISAIQSLLGAYGGELKPVTRKMLEELLKRLKGGSYHAGGIVPGTGEVTARLLGGEAVLKRNVVANLGASTIAALNVGRSPSMAMAGASMTRNVTLHNHFHTPGGRSTDERAAAARLERELRLAGG